MFDIGFIEMMVIGLILLLVVGPERLPEVARTVGGWVRQAKQYVDTVTSELDQDLNLRELDRETRQATASAGDTQAQGKDSSSGQGPLAPEEPGELDPSGEGEGNADPQEADTRQEPGQADLYRRLKDDDQESGDRG